MSVAPDIRPRLNQETIFLPMPDGVLVRVKKQSFLLKGKNTYRWLSTLRPYLTGEFTVYGICSELEPSRREMVERIVGMLLELGALRDQQPELSDLSEAEVQTFQSQIDFIAHYSDRPLGRLAHFRQSRILILGDGPAIASLCGSLIRNGVREITVSGVEDGLADAENGVSQLREAGVEARIRFISDGCSNFDSRKFHFVTYCSTTPCFKRLAELNRECYQSGVPFLAGFLFAGRMFMGPLVRPGTPVCALCSLLRLSDNIDEGARSGLWKSVALGIGIENHESEGFALSSRMLGNGMSFELFKFIAGHMPAETIQGVIAQDLCTLEASREAVLPYPLCPVCSTAGLTMERDRLASIVRGEADSALSAGEQSTLWRRYTGTNFGLLNARALIRSNVSTSRPANSSSGDEDGSNADTRIADLKKAISAYTERMPDTRRMLKGSFRRLSEERFDLIEPRRISNWSRGPRYESDEPIEWMPAIARYSRRECLVPAAAVYALSPLNSDGVFDRTLAGNAIGSTFTQLRIEGAQSMLSYERMRDALIGQAAVVKLAPAFVSDALALANEELPSDLKELSNLSSTFSIFELRGESPVRLILVRAAKADSTIEITRAGWGLSALDAVRQAIREAAAALRSADDGAGAEPSVEFWREFDLQYCTVAGEAEQCDFDHSANDLESIDSYLQAQGRESLIVNTTSSDVMETNTFLTGKVLFARMPNPLGEG